MSDDPNESDGHKIERGLYAVAAAIESLATCIAGIALEIEALKEEFVKEKEKS